MKTDEEGTGQEENKIFDKDNKEVVKGNKHQLTCTE